MSEISIAEDDGFWEKTCFSIERLSEREENRLVPWFLVCLVCSISSDLASM